MKNVKRVLAVLLVCIMSMQIIVCASTHTVTKDGEFSIVKLKYTSYKTSKGVKKVKNGKILSVKGKVGFLYLWEFVPKKKTLSLSKDGTKYTVKVTGTLYRNYLTQGSSKENKTETFTFKYK